MKGVRTRITYQRLIMLLFIFGLFMFQVNAVNSGNAINSEGMLNGENSVNNGNASNENIVCAVYFTGIGCPHCAKTDPYIFLELLRSNPNLVVIEYEVYRTSGNADLMSAYCDYYNISMCMIPHIFLPSTKLLGDRNILSNLNNAVETETDSSCYLLDKIVSYKDLNFNELTGVKVWKGSRILMRNGVAETNNDVLKELLNSTSCGIKHILDDSGINYSIVNPIAVELSGRVVEFDNAVSLNGWIFQWNGEGLDGTVGNVSMIDSSYKGPSDLTIAKVLSLAAVDAVNPCALAVLTLMLIAILTYNPKKKHKVLLAGFAFTLSVFIMYLFYGLVIIRFFQLVQVLTSIRLMLYMVLGCVAIILGILNIKDFVHYKPGSLGTEMPMSMRPAVKKLISGVTSPKGAFVVGIFVTVFLLPCTIGPYVIAGGILSALELLETVPWLILYNLVFVLPMIGITVVIYLGMAEVEDVSGWKEKHIRKLHLIAGIIMLLLGIGMVFGLI